MARAVDREVAQAVDRDGGADGRSRGGAGCRSRGGAGGGSRRRRRRSIETVAPGDENTGRRVRQHGAVWRNVGREGVAQWRLGSAGGEIRRLRAI